MKQLFSLILLFSLPISVFAAEGRSGGSFILSANGGVFNSKAQTGTAIDRETEVTNLDGQLGYVFSSGIYVGGLYGNSIFKTQGAVSDPEMTHSGASLGYMSASGFFLIGHGIMNAEMKKATATADRIDGSGSQIDLGFVKNLFGPIFLGAQISSRSLEYKKLDTAGVETESEHKVTDLFPAIRLSIIW